MEIRKCGRSGCYDTVLEINPKTNKPFYYCLPHREARKFDKQKQYAKFKDKYNQYSKKSWETLKGQFIELYGSTCECCEESNVDLLTLDHFQGGGQQHRSKIGSWQVYREAVNTYQPNKYRVLCYNCNFCIGMHGSCLHKNTELEKKHERLVTSSEAGNSRYWNYNLRVKFLDLYGRACVTCGQTGNVFLTLDHIQGDGHKDRQESGDGWLAYRKAIKKVDHSKYRTLCCNCNMSRKYQGVVNHG